jgi:hypothetical protein
LVLSFSDGIAFSPFSLQEGGLPSPEVDIGGRKVLQALTVAAVIAMVDEVAS